MNLNRKLTKHLGREFFAPKGATKVSDKLSDAVAYLYDRTTTKGPKPCGCVFFGKQSQPVARYAYRDEAERERSITQLFQSRRDHDKRKADQRAEDKAYRHDAKVGDIYRTCWGYDQTNVEFF